MNNTTERWSSKTIFIHPPVRGYNVILQGNPPQSVYRVIVQGTLCERVKYYSSEQDAWNHYERLTLLLRKAAGVRPDGVPDLDVQAFRHYLYSLPRGRCAGSYAHPFTHPLAQWCSYLTGKNFWFNTTSYAPCRVQELGEEGLPKHLTLLTAPRPVPVEVGTYLGHTLGRSSIVTRDQALADLQLSLCISHDALTFAHRFGAKLLY